MLHFFQVPLKIPSMGVSELFLPLFFGCISAFVGIIPPGLLNMTAAKVNHKEGRRNAVWFVFGALLIICVQVFFSVLFAKIINSNPEVVTLLREIGFCIFTALTIYFLLIAKAPTSKPKKLKKNTKTSRFFLGILLSSLNLFPIPYYVFVSIFLASFKLISFDTTAILIFVSGTLLGSFLAFYFYISFFDRFATKSEYILKNMNYIIGSITGLISIVNLINILKPYF